MNLFSLDQNDKSDIPLLNIKLFKFNGMRFFGVSLLILVINLSLAKKNKKIVDKERQLYEYLVEDEAHLQEPYLGGYNSEDAKILIVTFKQMTEISESINPRWPKNNFKQMVQDMQDMLLTGGVRTNIFR